MYLVGEALIGDGAEIAHIDLLMGDKEGPIGSAFCKRDFTAFGRAHPAARCRPPEPAHKASHARHPEGHLKGYGTSQRDVRSCAGCGCKGSCRLC